MSGPAVSSKRQAAMDFGICVAAKVDEIGYITHAENLGYFHAWVADSQMI